MGKVAQFYRDKNKYRYKPTHYGIIRKVSNPREFCEVHLCEKSKVWATIEPKVLYRKQDGMERGKAETSIWQLDISSIKPLEQSNEAV